jgi:hypothetical protein
MLPGTSQCEILLEIPGMPNKRDEYRMPTAEKLLDLYEEANGRPADTIADLTEWILSPPGKAATGYDPEAGWKPLVKVKISNAPAVKRDAEQDWCRQILAPPQREPSYPESEPLRRPFLELVLWFGATGTGLAVYLWAFTQWLWLVAHEGLFT